MTKHETIAEITAQLVHLDELQLAELADYIETLTSSDELPRALTALETALIEQSKEDFRTGRTYSLDEMDAYLDAAAARRASARQP
jgi:hypothetical protein